MVVWQTVKQIKTQYKAYLSEQYPEWDESKINSCVADTFYLYNNDAVENFWTYLVSEETMELAREELLDYLKNEIMSENAEQRTERYFEALSILKTYFDVEFGGVKNRIGKEFDAEETLFEYCLAAYRGELSLDEAAAKMNEIVPAYKSASHKLMAMCFASMMDGKKYTRRCSAEMTVFLLRKIGKFFGQERVRKALEAVKGNIQYYFEQTGQKSDSMRRGGMKVAAEMAIAMDFSNAIFDGIIPKKSTDTILEDDNSAVRYWLYAAGAQSTNWEDDRAEGIMAIGYGDLGDLSLYDSKEAIRNRMQMDSGQTVSFKMSVHAVWQFANEIKPGDVVFVKKGLTKIIGKGVVTGDYEYDAARADYKHLRRVNWTDAGEWTYAGQLPQKTLTDITPYKDMVKEILAMFDEELPERYETEAENEEYTKNSFLDEVYMKEEAYDDLCELLLTQKNVILMGAPGVGKTFAATRLAYSILQQKDRSRVKVIQFHQSYSYEDFIMGYRPTETGFQLKTGVFYEFCKMAQDDEEHKYFFIIDEINRGNLSKIFGELFMLIEKDKRDSSIQLLYKDEEFRIPSNVHIIGMMNTADRSLAMMDYALRRRFAFFEMEPAFDSSGFRAYSAEIGNEKFNRLVGTVRSLNDAIAEDPSLGAGFRIGHSYFITKQFSEKWLRNLVKFQLIPLLKEYWYDEPEKVQTWSERLRGAIS